MRALTLTQPWATLMALGLKTIETRSWGTLYRGSVAIHAAKGFPPRARWICWTPPFRAALAAAGYDGPQQLPLGAILAVVDLVDCWPTGSLFARPSPLERAFGDFGPGRVAWETDGLQPLAVPIPWKGALGLWTLPDEVITRALHEAPKA